ncbi:MAG TPA: hypothetical protein VGK94_14460 [Candidatus Polarisedimenticolia bacterium]|jgi:hypothetical protein
MPRIVIGPTIEVHYQSPSEMAADLVSHLASGRYPIESCEGLRAGESRDVVIHVPLLGRQVHLSGRIVSVESPAGAQSWHLVLGDGAHDTLEHLRQIVGRMRSGGLLEEAREAQKEDGTELSIEQRIRGMSPTLRALLAAKANAEERLVLSREADPRVIEFLLKNPSLTIDEVRRLGSRLSLNQGHFATILRNPAWMADESLRSILARNPRLPEFLAEQVIQPLGTPVLRNLVESVNTTAGTRRVASRVLQTRGIVVSARKGS